MIRLIPLEQGEALNALCAQYGITPAEGIHGYCSADSALKAQCVFSLKQYEARLLAYEVPENDPLLEELIIRAVASYAANRSGYLFKIAKSVGQPMAATLKLLQFEENETEE